MTLILEPFADNAYLNNYKILLNMEKVVRNPNGEIWMFWNSDLNCEVLESDEQHITCTIQHVEYKGKFIFSLFMPSARTVSEDLFGTGLFISPI